MQGISVGVDGFTYDYPATYGVGGCAAHDALLPPFCKVVLPPGSMVQVELQKWCFMPWCYVNISECALSSTPTTYDWNVSSDQLQFLGYSYSTCDSPDLYTEVYSESAVIAARLAAEREQARHLTRVVLASVLSPLLVCLLIACMVCHLRSRQIRRLRRLESSRLRYVEGRGMASAKPLEDPLRYHLFLSHVWGSGQDRMRMLKDRMLVLMDDLKVFLDVDDLREGNGAERVEESEWTLCYLSEGYFNSISCMREILWATCYRRPIMLLINERRKYAGISLEDGRALLQKAYISFADWGLFDELESRGQSIPSLADIETAMFDKGRVFEWSHVRLFHDAMLQKMLQPFVQPRLRPAHRALTSKSLTSNLTSFCGSKCVQTSSGDSTPGMEAEPITSLGSDKRAATFMEGDLTRKQTPLPPPRAGMRFHVYASLHDPGACELMDEVKASRRLSALKVSSQVAEMHECEQMVLLLRTDTWTARSAMALAREVRQALLCRIPLLLTNEDTGEDDEERKGASFEKIIASTPISLLSMGIYSKISIPLKGGFLRPYSLAILSEVLNAVWRPRFTWLRRPTAVPSLPSSEALVRGRLGLGSEEGEVGELVLPERGHNLRRDESVWGRVGAGLNPYMNAPRQPDRRQAFIRSANVTMQATANVLVEKRKNAVVDKWKGALSPFKVAASSSSASNADGPPDPAPRAATDPVATATAWRKRRMTTFKVLPFRKIGSTPASVVTSVEAQKAEAAIIDPVKPFVPGE